VTERRAHVTTFYSFKGGVGRSILLANVGAHLAVKRGRRVLLWDLDVEAPGLQNIEALRPADEPGDGFLEWLAARSKSQSDKPPTEAALKKLARLARPTALDEKLFVLPAFGPGDAATTYASIDWQDLMIGRGDATLALFRSVLATLAEEHRLDHILIDSRTGLTDLGGLLAAVLPHAVALVGNYGQQNFAGLKQVRDGLTDAIEGRLPERGDDARLEHFFVMSPVPEGQDDLRAERAKAWQSVYSFGPNVAAPAGLLFEIPFNPRLLFRERLFVLDEPASAAAKAYAAVGDRVATLRDDWSEARDSSLREEVAAAPALGRRRGKDSAKAQGDRFEDRVALLLRLSGYDVEPEQHVGANRIDLVAKLKAGLIETCFFVECKDHSKPVDKETVERFKTWLNAPEALRQRAQGLFVARAFSPAALSYAREQNILAKTPEDLERSLFDFGPYLDKLCRGYEATALAKTYVEQRVLLEKERSNAAGVDLMTHAGEWADGEGGKLWLVLGDYGTGKSAFVSTLAYRMARRAKEDANAPIPVAVNLRDYPNATSLEQLFAEHFRGTLDRSVDPKIFVHLLDSGRIVLLLDSFDEMGVAAVGVGIDEQFRRLATPTKNPGTGPRSNRILITCRTHFFRDQQEAKGAAAGLKDDLVAVDSELGRVARSFDATIDELLLFNEEQVGAYLRKNLPESEARATERFIKETYDLSSLAPRPVLLEMILRSAPAMKEKKGPITPTALYVRYTEDWLRDATKNLRTTAEQRRLLLEELAVLLWKTPGGRLHYRRLSEAIGNLPAPRRGSIDPERIDLELRTATFLIRSADGNYYFSHKSFLEFFLARALVRCVVEGDGKNGVARFADQLETPLLSPEVVHFFGPLLQEPKQRKRAADWLATILTSPPRTLVSLNALRMARELSGGAQTSPYGVEFDVLPPEGADLSGQVLEGWNLSGVRLPRARLIGTRIERCNLSKADLSSADLSDAIVLEVDLSSADLTRASFRTARLSDVDANGASADGLDGESSSHTAVSWLRSKLHAANFRHASFHDVRLSGADVTGTIWDSAAFVASTGTALVGPRPNGVRAAPKSPRPYLRLFQSGGHNTAVFDAAQLVVLTAGGDGVARLFDAATGKELRRFEGHRGSLRSAVFGPGGTGVLTAGDDRTARLFDAKSGRELRRFDGHRGTVRSVAFDAAGTRILTAGDDETARLFDAESGEQVRRFDGHGAAVRSAAFDHEGRRVLTASLDATARIFDAASGMEIRRICIHRGFLRSAVFHPTGRRVLTACGDGIARLHDADTGEELLRYERHLGAVHSASFDSSGAHVVTAGADRTVRLFDAPTGRLLRIFDGHPVAAASAVFDALGTRVLTAAGDGTVRIFDVASGKELRRFGPGCDRGWRNGRLEAPAARPCALNDESSDRRVETIAAHDRHAVGVPDELDKVLDAEGRWRGHGKALELLSYVDPDEVALIPTHWHPEDLPEMRVPDVEAGATVAPSTPVIADSPTRPQSPKTRRKRS
jgi:WD40 repeat protein